MKILASISLLFSLFFSTLFMTKTSDNNSEKSPYYMNWEKIRLHINHHHNKLALKEAKELYRLLRKTNYETEKTKCLVYIRFLETDLEDDRDNFREDFLYKLDKDIEKTSGVSSLYLNLIGHKILNDYLNSYQVSFSKDDSVNPKDVKTWTQDYANRKLKEYQSGYLKDIHLVKGDSLMNPLFFNRGNNMHFYLQDAYHALLKYDLDILKGKVERAVKLSEQEWEDALMNSTCTDAELNELFQKFDDFTEYFSSDILKNRFLMEKWRWIVNQTNTSSIKKIYLEKLDRLGEKYPNNPEIKLRKAILFKEQAQEISFNQVPKKEAIQELKKQKSDLLKKALVLLNETKALSESNPFNEIVSKQAEVLKTNILDESIQIHSEEQYLSDQDIVFKLTSKNTDLIELELYNVDIDDFEKNIHNNYRDVNIHSFKSAKKVKDFKFSVNYSYEYIEEKREIILPKLPYGLYAVKLKNESSLLFFQVSDLFLLQEKREYKIRNAKNNNPVLDAYFYEVGKSKKESFDKCGNLTLSTKDRQSFVVEKGEDRLLFLRSYNWNNKIYSHTGRTVIHYEDKIFTDRAIYRPGQKVEVKVLRLSKYNTDVFFGLTPNKKLEISLKDPSYKTIATKKVTLNDYGTGYITFDLPKGGVNGSYRLQTDEYGGVSIQMEEYKRPGFFIETELTDKEKVLGETLKLPISAQTFSGIPLQRAKVNYKISYKEMPIHFWRWGCTYFWNPSTLFDSGKSILDANGKQWIEIDTKKIPLGIRENNILSFEVEVKVQDETGNTEEKTLSFNLGNESINLDIIGAKAVFEKDKISINPRVTNYAQKEVEKELSYELWSIENFNKKIFEETSIDFEKAIVTEDVKDNREFKYSDKYLLENLKRENKVAEGTLKSNIQKDIFTTKKQGVYLLKVKTKDKNGKEVSKEQYFQVLPNKGKLANHINKIVVSSDKSSYEVGEKMKLKFVLPHLSKYRLEIRNRDKVVWSTCNDGNSIEKTEYTITEKDRGGLSVFVFSIYDGEEYKHQKSIHIPFTNKQLKTKWIHFTDKTRPATKEEWKLEIKDWKGKVKSTEVLAFMYDKSLDEIKKHNIRNQIYQYPLSYIRFPIEKVDLGVHYSYLQQRAQNKYFTPMDFYGINQVSWDWYINQFTINSYRSSFSRGGGGDLNSMVLVENSLIAYDEAAPEMKSKRSRSGLLGIASDKNMVSDTEEKESPKPLTIRKNFQETVFFYPNLYTDKDGVISIPFISTDKVGEYKVMLYGLTKDLEQFYLEEKVISNKELMVELNKPKFLYGGDKIHFSAKVSNLTEKAFPSEVSIELADNLTGEILYASGLRKTGEISSKGSITERFEFSIPDDFTGELRCRFTAEATEYTDVEESIITVLGQSQRLNEQWAFTLPAKGQKEILLKDYLNATSFDRFRVEALSNPLWQVVKSIPYVQSDNDKILTNLLDEWLSIEIAQKLLNENPDLENRLQAYVKSHPKSELKKKSEYKNITIEESPWVLEAENQEEEILALADFFNQNKIEYRKQSILNKLKKFQKSSGGVTWYQGSKYESESMSLYALETFSAIKDINPKAVSNQSSFIKGILKYLDTEHLKKYKKEKDAAKRHNYTPYNYMEYRIDFQDEKPISGKVSEMYNYYLNKLLKNWTKVSFNTRLSIWNIALKNGKMSVSDKIYTSLKENAHKNKVQQTMYWKSLANGISWNNRKFVLQSKIARLFKEIGDADNALLIENWLIQQKRSTHWNSSSETAKIVYSLLYKNPNLNLLEKGKVNIFINNQKQDLQSLDALSWEYISFENNKGIDLNTAKIRFENKANHPVWISMYHQYWSKIKDVKQEKDPNCFITKRLYEQEVYDDKEMWKEVQVNQLKLGDRIKVKLTFDFKQQLDFVVLEDYFAGCQEPKDKLSGWNWDRGGSYYKNIKDQKMQFFFDKIARGKYNFEYETNITQLGEFTLGYAQFQSFYAPEFGSHSEGGSVEVVE
jgi:uncharacterized protein YfaS (alpha-2-macroglobulin family)